MRHNQQKKKKKEEEGEEEESLQALESNWGKIRKDELKEGE